MRKYRHQNVYERLRHTVTINSTPNTHHTTRGEVISLCFAGRSKGCGFHIQCPSCEDSQYRSWVLEILDSEIQWACVWDRKTIANKEAVLQDPVSAHHSGTPGPSADKTGKMVHLCLFLKERFICILSKLLPVFLFIRTQPPPPLKRCWTQRNKVGNWLPGAGGGIGEIGKGW